MSRGGHRDFLVIAHEALSLFDEQGSVDLAQFERLIEIALRDGVLDGDEKQVLRKLITLVDDDSISRELHDRIEKLHTQYGV